MYPEKKIATMWLNRQGFSVISNINAGRNKVIGTVAIRTRAGARPEVWHVEVSCSITKSPERPDDIGAKFNDKHVTKSIQQYLEEHGMEVPAYQKVLVSTSPYDIAEVKVYLFEDVLLDVLDSLDRQNYNDPIVRALQLVKYLAMARPQSLAKLLEQEKIFKTLKDTDRERFLSELLAQSETKRILAKPSFEHAIVDILARSDLNRADLLASAILEQVVTPRSRRAFVAAILKHKDVMALMPRDVAKNMQLADFLKDAQE